MKAHLRKPRRQPNAFLHNCKLQASSLPISARLKVIKQAASMYTSPRRCILTTNTDKQTPAWFQEYLTSFLSANAHGFILYGDISGYAYESVSHTGYLLAALSAKRDVVACYDRATGITFATQE